MDKLSEDQPLLLHLHEGRLTTESLDPNPGEIVGRYGLLNSTRLTTTSGFTEH